VSFSQEVLCVCERERESIMQSNFIKGIPKKKEKSGKANENAKPKFAHLCIFSSTFMAY